MTKQEIEHIIDFDFINLQLQRLQQDKLKPSTISSYISRSLQSDNRNMKDYVNNQIIKAIHKYIQVNGED